MEYKENMEDTAAENIIKVVGILTAILSGQEEQAFQMVLEADVIELFSALTGLLLNAMSTIADANNTTVETYLQNLGWSAARAL
jgi:hypothetical protein